MNPFTLRFLEPDSEFQVNQDFTVQIINQIDGERIRNSPGCMHVRPSPAFPLPVIF